MSKVIRLKFEKDIKAYTEREKNLRGQTYKKKVGWKRNNKQNQDINFLESRCQKRSLKVEKKEIKLTGSTYSFQLMPETADSLKFISITVYCF